MIATLNVKIGLAPNSFFDRRVIQRQMSAAKIRVFSKFGAFVRQRARSSMRKARQMSLAEMSTAELIVYEEKKRWAIREGMDTPKRPLAPSEPGKPPRVVTGLLEQHLYFAYDRQTDSVVIGPALIRANSDVPRVLEVGGLTDLRNGRSGTIKARPYMRPAFEAEIHNVPYLWAGALDQL